MKLKLIYVMILVLLGGGLVACGRDQVYCTVDGGLSTVTVCVEADPAHAEVHAITQVKTIGGGKGLFISEPDVIRRAPYSAAILYKRYDDRGKPDGIVVTIKVIPRSPNVKSITCKIYHEKQLVNQQTKSQEQFNTDAVCVYETPLPKA